jgi:uncharacterized membrane protein SpoIIM required for sporulation
MTKEQQQPETTGRLNLSSKHMRLFLVALAAILTFGGPWIVYLLLNGLDLSGAISYSAGFACLAVGLILFWYLIRKHVIS